MNEAITKKQRSWPVGYDYYLGKLRIGYAGEYEMKRECIIARVWLPGIKSEWEDCKTTEEAQEMCERKISEWLKLTGLGKAQ